MGMKLAQEVNDYLLRVDGPGRQKSGVFVNCRDCEQRVFIHETSRPWRCPNCGCSYEQKRIDRGKRRKSF